MSSPLTVNVQSFRTNNNEHRKRAIKSVLESTFNTFLNSFDIEIDAPVNVAWWPRPKPPKALYNYRPYQIRINAQGNSWCQYVYQFSHELCHVITNFDRFTKHKHKWFEESLCEMASLFVLHKLAEVWIEDPPRDIDKACCFAEDHAKYAQKIEDKYRPPCNLSEWLATNIQNMEANSTERHLNGIVAVALLSDFRQDPSLWRDCTRLNLWNTNKDETFLDYLNSWDAYLLENSQASGRVPSIVRALFYPNEA